MLFIRNFKIESFYQSYVFFICKIKFLYNYVNSNVFNLHLSKIKLF